jgi:hypothetical protein
LLAALRIYFFKREKKKGKKEKRKLSFRRVRLGCQGFWKKYYPKGGDFFTKQAKRTLAALASARL